MKIIQIDGTGLDFDISDSELAFHFANQYNYTDAILAQFKDNLYKQFIAPADRVILDIGANVGLFALHVMPYVDRIICVEPTPEHMSKQRKILTGYPVEHEEAALSDHTGETKFYWCGINTTMNSLQPRGDREFMVPCITLKDLCDKYKLQKVNFCKIDIEGSEWTALTPETIKPVYDTIDKIFVELHPPDSASQEKFKAVFEEAGYIVETFIHDSLFCHK